MADEMQDEFFEDITDKKEVEREQPTGSEIVPPKKKENKGKFYAIVAVLLVISFFVGMTARWYMIDPEMRTLIRIKQTIDKRYYTEISDDDFYGAIFGAINQEVLDDYSEYMTPEQYQKMLEDSAGRRDGLGLTFVSSEKTLKKIQIARVCLGSPAEEVGLQAGGYISGFGLTETEVSESTNYTAFADFVKERKEGELFFVRYEKDGRTQILGLRTKVYTENFVEYRTNEKAGVFNGAKATWTEKGNPLSCLDNDTAYIRLLKFTGNSATEFKSAMEKFKTNGKKNLVLDLRGNGGGYMDILQEIASYFCKDTTSAKPLVAIADYGEKRERFYASGNRYKNYFVQDSRICVLADEETASASECLLGAMLDYGAISYGDICLTERKGVAKTYGKGIMQTTYYLDPVKKDALKLTTARVLWPKTETCIHDRGVVSADGTKTTAQSFEGDTELISAVQALFG